MCGCGVCVRWRFNVTFPVCLPLSRGLDCLRELRAAERLRSACLSQLARNIHTFFFFFRVKMRSDWLRLWDTNFRALLDEM